jgi:ribonuclease HII
MSGRGCAASLYNLSMAGIAAASSLERALLIEGRRNIAGCDEAGRGALAGPLIAAACVLDYAALPAIIADSKSVGPARRNEAAALIRERALGWAVANISPARVDRLNVLQASLLAMANALEHIERGGLRIEAVLADGPHAPTPSLARGAGAPVQAVVGGDGKCACVAAASILAKTARDALMRQAARRYPLYGFERNMGYPTPEHLAALREHGPCAIHRRSFAPVREVLERGLFD